MPIRLFFLALAILTSSCAMPEDQRVRQMLNESGFGTQAEGEATVENYVAGGDSVVFLVDPLALATPGLEQLSLLSIAQQVGLDGTIVLPYVGRIMVLGLTERELKQLVESQLGTILADRVSVTPRIIDLGKVFYAFGEVIRKGRIPYTKADLTVFEAVSVLGPTPVANMGRVRLIKPDAINPIVVEVNFREMVTGGVMQRNFLVSENDIIYIPPTWLGSIARFVEKLLQPLGVAVQTLFGIASIRYSYDLIQGDTQNYFFRF